MKKVLIASRNPGKIATYKEILNELNIEGISLYDININIDVVEDGVDEIANAIKKAEAYYKKSGLPTLADDCGLIISKFKQEDQPGQFVRRYKGRELSDEEALSLYVDKLNEVGGESDGHYVVALAAIDEMGQLFFEQFQLQRHFISRPSDIIIKGIPLSSLCYDEKSNKYLSEMSIYEKNEYDGKELKRQKEFIQKIFI